MKLFAILVSAFLMASNAQALELNYGLIVGAQMNDGEPPEGFMDNGKLGYKGGALVGINGLMDRITLTTGVIYNYRPYELEAYLFKVKYNLTYIDVPVLVRYALNEDIGVYAGPVMAFNIGNSAETTDLSGAGGGTASADDDNVKSFYLSAEVGINFKYEHCGLDIYYQYGMGEFIDNGPKNLTSVGANYTYWF